MRLIGDVVVYAAVGLVTPDSLHLIHREVVANLPAGANACVFDCARSVMVVSAMELIAIALGGAQAHRLRRMTGAWVVPSVNLQDCRAVALQLATYGIARRIFTTYAPALAWAQEEAALRR